MLRCGFLLINPSSLLDSLGKTNRTEAAWCVSVTVRLSSRGSCWLTVVQLGFCSRFKSAARLCEMWRGLLCVKCKPSSCANVFVFHWVSIISDRQGCLSLQVPNTLTCSPAVLHVSDHSVFSVYTRLSECSNDKRTITIVLYYNQYYRILPRTGAQQLTLQWRDWTGIFTAWSCWLIYISLI